MLKAFWKPKMDVTFVLKSGVKIEIKCKDISIKHKGNTLTEYEIVGLSPATNLFYLKIEEVAAILIKK